jgi:hypothetical protein
MTRGSRSPSSGRIRQIAVQQQVAGLEVVAVDRHLLDRVAAIEQFALVTVDVGDLGFARGGRQEARVEGELAGRAIELADVDHIGADRALVDREIDGGRAVFEGQRGFVLGGHRVIPVVQSMRRFSGSAGAALCAAATGLAAAGVAASPSQLGARQDQVEQVVVGQIEQLVETGHVGIVDEVSCGRRTARGPDRSRAGPGAQRQRRRRRCAGSDWCPIGARRAPLDAWPGQTARRTISSLILPIARVGFSPSGRRRRSS